jgi:ATP/maltotriose-dependent transcriptional regulator MalT
MKNAMDETGMRPDASLLEYHLLYYIRGLISPSDDPFTGSVAAEILNSTPGYENLVVASGELLHLWLRRAASVSDEADEVLDPGRMQFPSSLLTRVYVCQADAHLRLGDLDAAISALVESRRIRANTDEWFFALGERFQGSDSCAAAIVQAISRHPNATEETQSLLDEIFPEFRQ